MKNVKVSYIISYDLVKRFLSKLPPFLPPTITPSLPPSVPADKVCNVLQCLKVLVILVVYGDRLDRGAGCRGGCRLC